MDELWSFVGAKANRHWVWIALDATTRQVIAVHVGDRSGQSATAVWEQIPTDYQEQATFYTDQYEVYKGVILQPSTTRSPRSLARPITSNASTARYGSESPGWYALRERSRRTLPIILGRSNTSSVTITSPDVQHYQGSTTACFTSSPATGQAPCSSRCSTMRSTT